MSKKTSVRTVAPDAAPATTTGDAVSAPVEGSTAATESEAKQPSAAAPVTTAAVHRLEVAQALPLLSDDESECPVVFEPGTIERFKSADGWTMRIVANSAGELRSALAND